MQYKTKTHISNIEESMAKALCSQVCHTSGCHTLIIAYCSWCNISVVSGGISM